eukprot:14225096-Alexandrium_andersonii.AAC.1
MLEAVCQKAREAANAPAYFDELHVTPAAESYLKHHNDEYAVGGATPASRSPGTTSRTASTARSAPS